jgi:membrane-associated phospholipid phosphatase
VTTRSNETESELVDRPAQAGRWTRLSGWSVRLVLALVLLGPAWMLDKPLYGFSRPKYTRDALSDWTDMAQLFGEWQGIAMILLMIWVLDRARRRWLVLVLVAALSAGGLAAGAKLLIGRERPRVSGGRTTFRWPAAPASHQKDPGFPSGHAAAAFALAFVLSQLYPKGRWMFRGYAIACAASRVYGGMHFLTDVLAGGWLGTEIARLVWQSMLLERYTARLPEASWFPRSPRPSSGEIPQRRRAVPWRTSSAGPVAAARDRGLGNQIVS